MTQEINIFDPTDTTVETDTHDDLYIQYVQEKYGDVDADPVLAKAIFHKDKHIENLQREQAGIRQDLQQRIKMEEFLDRLNSNIIQDTSNEQDPPGRENVTRDKPLTAEDVKRLLQEQQIIDRQRKNTQEVIDTLRTKLGPDYSTKVKSMLNQIGMDDARANQIASDSPAAFYRLLNLDQRTQENFTPPPRTAVNTSGLPTVRQGPTKYSDFERMRKEKPDQYWSPQIQNQLHQLTEQHGVDWLKT